MQLRNWLSLCVHTVDFLKRVINLVALKLVSISLTLETKTLKLAIRKKNLQASVF